MDAATLSVHGETTCAAARVDVSVEGLDGRTPPTLTASLAAVNSKPTGVGIQISGIRSKAAVTSSPASFTFRVCATGVPEGVDSGTVTIQATVVAPSQTGEWSVQNAAGSDTATLKVNRGPDRPSETPSLTLIVTPVEMRMAKQNGEAVFQFDVAASEGFPGRVIGNVNISAPGNPDDVELLEGTRANSLSFAFGSGQKLSDAHNLMYRIRTTANNQREGVLIYSVSLSSAGGEVTTRNSAQEIRVTVGDNGHH